MSIYEVTYKEVLPHPAGGTYLAGPYLRTLEASDARTARDAIRGIYPKAKIVKVVDCEARYEARVVRGERWRNR